MGDTNKLNAIAQAVMAQKAQEQPQPEQSPEAPHEETCPMCGQMVQGMDPAKLAAFMQNNPFKK